MFLSPFLRAIHIMALPGDPGPAYPDCLEKGRTMGLAVSGRPPSPRHRGPAVDESIRRRDPRVQDVAVALLLMDLADRRPLIRPLLALIQRAAADGGGPTSAPGTPAN
jgi:hypothetical protein